MKRRWPVYRLVLLATLALAIAGIVFRAMQFGQPHRLADGLVIAALALIAGASGVVLHGLWSTHRRMKSALRFLLAGEFDRRIELAVAGELADLVELLNRVTGQLKEYDELRASRTGYANRAMYMLLNRLTTPAIIVDLPRGTGRLNAACQRALDVTSVSVSIEFLLRQKCNEEFAAAFVEAFERVRRERKIACPLRLGPAAPPRHVDAALIPIKGETDDVELGLILITLHAKSPAAEQADQRAP